MVSVSWDSFETDKSVRIEVFSPKIQTMKKLVILITLSEVI